MLKIAFHDLLRATLPIKSGNEGWIGISPRGDDYHIVVPVDRQLARGVMAGYRPDDGTPFGGYSGWLYFRCPPFEEPDEGAGDSARLCVEQARQTARDLIAWLGTYDVEATLDPGADAPDDASVIAEAGEARPFREQRGSPRRAERDTSESVVLQCTGCGKSWTRIGAFLRDPEVRLDRYRVCLDDFHEGAFVFAHGCGGSIGVPVSRFARPKSRGRSLAGSHACPGLCYYEKSLASCSAVCDGSLYRRVAEKLICGSKALDGGQR
jgi:hypothetical protein